MAVPSKGTVHSQRSKGLCQLCFYRWRFALNISKNHAHGSDPWFWIWKPLKRPALAGPKQSRGDTFSTRRHTGQAPKLLRPILADRFILIYTIPYVPFSGSLIPALAGWQKKKSFVVHLPSGFASRYPSFKACSEKSSALGRVEADVRFWDVIRVTWWISTGFHYQSWLRELTTSRRHLFMHRLHLCRSLGCFNSAPKPRTSSELPSLDTPISPVKLLDWAAWAIDISRHPRLMGGDTMKYLCNTVGIIHFHREFWS